MPKLFPGGVVSATALSPSTSSAKGFWGLQDEMQAQQSGNWPGASNQTFTNRVAFTYTGADQIWSVPAGITLLRVKAWGAGGTGAGSSTPGGGGAGAGARAIDLGISVTPGETLTIQLGQSVAYVGVNGGCGIQNSAYGGGGSGSGGAGGTGDTAGTNGNSGGSGGGSSAVTRSGTLLCAAGGGGGGGGPTGFASGNPLNGYPGSNATGGTGGARTGAGTSVNGANGANYGGGGGGGGSGSTQAGNGAQGGNCGSSLVPSKPAGYPYNQNDYASSGQTPGNSSDSDRQSSGTGGAGTSPAGGGGSPGENGMIVIYY